MKFPALVCGVGFAGTVFTLWFRVVAGRLGARFVSVCLVVAGLSLLILKGLVTARTFFEELIGQGSQVVSVRSALVPQKPFVLSLEGSI